MSPATTSGFFSSEGSVARYPASSASSHAVSCFVMEVGAWAEVEYRKAVDDALVNTCCKLLRSPYLLRRDNPAVVIARQARRDVHEQALALELRLLGVVSTSHMNLALSLSCLVAPGLSDFL
jgi:hypothetical protein